MEKEINAAYMARLEAICGAVPATEWGAWEGDEEPLAGSNVRDWSHLVYVVTACEAMPILIAEVRRLREREEDRRQDSMEARWH